MVKCEKLNNNQCSIYKDRPIHCNVDMFYEKYLKSTLTKDYYYKLNKQKCREFQRGES